MGTREEYYKKLKDLSKEIKKEWKEITNNNKGSYSTLSSFANKLNGTLSSLKKERDKTINDLDVTNNLLSTTSVLHKSIGEQLRGGTKELGKQNVELNKQKNVYDKIKDGVVKIGSTLRGLGKLGKLDIKIKGTEGGKDILKETINNAINSIKGLIPIVKTAVTLISGILNSVFKNIANGISQLSLSFEQRGLRGLRSGAKAAREEFKKIGPEIENVVKSTAKIYEAYRAIEDLEKIVQARQFNLEKAAARLEVFEKEKEIKDLTNLSLEESLALLDEQYKKELVVIGANRDLLLAQRELAIKEKFIGDIKKENTKDKEAQINLLNVELEKLSKQKIFLDDLLKIQKQLTIIQEVGTKTNFDRIKIISALQKELKNLYFVENEGEFLLGKEIEKINKSLAETRILARSAFNEIKAKGIDINVDNILRNLEEGLDPELFRETLLNKNFNKDVIDNLVKIYTDYYNTIADLQESAQEKNKEIIERNKQAIIETIELEFETEKRAIDEISNKYLDYKQILEDIESSNLDIITKTIMSVNALKRGFIELNKKWNDNLELLEKYDELLEKVGQNEQFFIEEIKKRTDLTEQEKENEITKIKRRYEQERKEIEETKDKILESNNEILREQENIKNSITKQYNELFANIFDKLTNIAGQVTTELNNYLDRQAGYIDNYITRLQNMYNVQQALLGKVSDLQIDKINREITQAEAEKRRIEKQKEAIETVNTLLQTYNSYLQAGQNPQQALLNSVKDILLIKTISRAIKGKFAKGIEGFKGAGTDTSDSNLVLISNNESIVTAQATRKYKGLVTAMNKGTVNEWIQQNNVNNYGKESHYDFIRLGNAIVSVVKNNNKYTI